MENGPRVMEYTNAQGGDGKMIIKRPKGCTRLARKVHRMQVREKKKVRRCPLSIDGVHEADKQPSQLAVHVAREQ